MTRLRDLLERAALLCRALAGFLKSFGLLLAAAAQVIVAVSVVGVSCEKNSGDEVYPSTAVATGTGSTATTAGGTLESVILGWQVIPVVGSSVRGCDEYASRSASGVTFGIEFMVVEDQPLQPGQETSIHVEAWLPYGVNVQYFWSLEGEGELAPHGPDAVYRATGLGTARVSVTVNQPEGWAYCLTKISVQEEQT